MKPHRSFVLITAALLGAPAGAVPAGEPTGAEPGFTRLRGFELELFAADGGAGPARSAAYRDGQQALDAGRWNEAAEIFRGLAAGKGSEADAALYWQAYALARASRQGEALAALRALRAGYPQSSWLDDAQALEVEMRGAKAGSAAGLDENDELRIYALAALMESDSARALPALQKFLAGDASPALKKRALFVLGQSDAPEARRMLGAIAQGRSSPELQIDAIQMLGIAGEEESIATLQQIYRQSTDSRVRKAILQAYLVADAGDQTLAVAQGDQDPEMRRAAIHQLGAMDATAQLRKLYALETSRDLRRALLQAFGVAGDVEALAQAARSEQDVELRKAAIHGLGITGEHAAAAALQQIYAAHPDVATRGAVIESLFIQDNATALIELFRAEKDRDLRRQIVQKLSLMDSAEATELMLKMLDE